MYKYVMHMDVKKTYESVMEYMELADILKSLHERREIEFYEIEHVNSKGEDYDIDVVRFSVYLRKCPNIHMKRWLDLFGFEEWAKFLMTKNRLEWQKENNRLYVPIGAFMGVFVFWNEFK